jgi:hypothetical protein
MPARLVITDEILVPLVTTALALQFAAFGWRIVREIQLGDEGRRTWFLVTDFLIIGSMCAVVAICIVLPIAGRREPWAIACTLAVAYIIIAAHPINTAAHYRLFSPWAAGSIASRGGMCRT